MFSITKALKNTLIFCFHFTNVFKEKKARGNFFYIQFLDLEQELMLKGLKNLIFSIMLLHGFFHQTLEAVLSRKRAEGPRCSSAGVIDPQMDPDLFGIVYSLVGQRTRRSRGPLLGEGPFFWEAGLPQWTPASQRSLGKSHLFTAGGWFVAPQKHTQCRKTCGGLWIFLQIQQSAPC